MALTPLVLSWPGATQQAGQHSAFTCPCLSLALDEFAVLIFPLGGVAWFWFSFVFYLYGMVNEYLLSLIGNLCTYTTQYNTHTHTHTHTHTEAQSPSHVYRHIPHRLI